MGAFDDIESHSQIRRSNLLGRSIGEARRRVVLVALFVGFLILSLLAFRRQDTIKEVVHNSFHRNNHTALLGSTRPGNAVSASSGSDIGDVRDVTLGKTDSTSNSRLQSELPDQPEGLKLDNGDRVLAPQSMRDLRNTSLGVSTQATLDMIPY